VQLILHLSSELDSSQIGIDAESIRCTPSHVKCPVSWDSPDTRLNGEWYLPSPRLLLTRMDELIHWPPDLAQLVIVLSHSSYMRAPEKSRLGSWQSWTVALWHLVTPVTNGQAEFTP